MACCLQSGHVIRCSPIASAFAPLNRFSRKLMRASRPGQLPGMVMGTPGT